MKKQIIAIVLFCVLLFGSYFTTALIKSEFGRLPLFFLTQDNVRFITLTRNGETKGSTETITLSEREKMIFISMYSKKLRMRKDDSGYSLETIKKANKVQGKIVNYYTIYLKPFGIIRVYGRYYIGGISLTYHDKYQNAAMTANQFLRYIGKEDVPPRYYGVYDED